MKKILNTFNKKQHTRTQSLLDEEYNKYKSAVCNTEPKSKIGGSSNKKEQLQFSDQKQTSDIDPSVKVLNMPSAVNKPTTKERNRDDLINKSYYTSLSKSISKCKEYDDRMEAIEKYRKNKKFSIYELDV